MFDDYQHVAERSARSQRSAAVASVAAHVIVGSLVLWLLTLPRSYGAFEQIRRTSNASLVWLASPGPGGGGGGGGNQTKTAAPVKDVGKDRLTVPAARTEPTPAEKPKDPPVEPLTIPVQTMAAATEITPGVVDPTPATESTQGSGSEGGAGSGADGGSGAGRGSGLGPGSGGGTGGGVYRLGSGVTTPQLVREVKPSYTADAMRAKKQGAVLLECVVLPDGTVGDVKIVQSLDAVFGLDEEAIKAAKQWKFLPGRRFGEPVPVLVKIELQFTLR